MEYKEKFIAFVDILGFTNLIEESESGQGMALGEILGLISCLDSPEDRAMFDEYGSSICPDVRPLTKNLDFQLTQISDCAVISMEPSAVGAVHLTYVCLRIVFRLMKRGFLCRGYITKGSIYHEDNQFFGSGYQRALEGEKHTTALQINAEEKGTPFVELDKDVSDFILSCGEECLIGKFKRMVRSVGSSYAVFPFDVFSRVNDPGPDTTLEQRLEANNVVRQAIHTLKNKVLAFDASDPKVRLKINHYVNALDEQLSNCDFSDEMSRKLAPR